jgi:hypothetical protein
MNKLSTLQTLKKHPLLATGALVLGSIIAAKVAHYLPLQDLDEQYLSELYANEFKLPPLITEYLSIDPYHTSIIPFWSDTILVVDATQKKTFVITCPKKSSWIDDNRTPITWDSMCLIRKNPTVHALTGTVFGSWNVMPRSFILIPFEWLPLSSESETPWEDTDRIDLNKI